MPTPSAPGPARVLRNAAAAISASFPVFQTVNSRVGRLRSSRAGRGFDQAEASSSRPWFRAFQLKVAHLIRTGNFTTP